MRGRSAQIPSSKNLSFFSKRKKLIHKRHTPHFELKFSQILYHDDLFLILFV